jgi:hypothetical protein
MGILDYIILGLIALGFIGAVRRMKKNGGCCGCGGSCGQCKKERKVKK